MDASSFNNEPEHPNSAQTVVASTSSAAEQIPTQNNNALSIEDYIQDRTMFSLLPISPQHPAVKRYESIRNTLLTAALEQIAGSLNAMSLFMLGRDDNTAKPAVVMMVSPSTVHDWKRLAEQLGKILNGGRALGEDMEIGVELIPGEALEARTGRFT